MYSQQQVTRIDEPRPVPLPPRATKLELAGNGLVLASRLPQEWPARESERLWGIEMLAGRFVEISGLGNTAPITATAVLIREAQLRGEPAVWVAAGPSTFFPPDLGDSGIDLGALPVIRVTNTAEATRAADRLLRSGAFALVILDLVPVSVTHRLPRTVIPIAGQTRLVGLCKKHHATLLCLTRKERETPSLGSLVSLRGEGAVRKTAFDRFTWELQILKDKRQGPGWSHAEVCRGPDGMC